ncbi:MAG: MFS transporter [Egibacteraceae bacterium]
MDAPSHPRADGREPAGPSSWRQPAVLTAAALSVPVGFAQFGPAAALSDVASTFGTAAVDPDAVEQLALSGGVIGLGYAVIRLSSLGSLAVAGSADRFGRRAVLLSTVAVGLVLTATSALAWSYWAFVAIFALGRPFLSASNAVAGVTAAEYTDTKNRSAAIVLVAAGYAVGTGLTLIVRYLGGDALGFRGLFGLAAVPLVLLPLAARKLKETARFTAVERTERAAMLGRVPTSVLPRLLLLMLLTGSIALVTGPANTYVFFYGEQVAGLSIGTVTLAGLIGGPVGLLGLLAGRWGADHVGRRVTSAAAMCFAAAGGVLLYSGLDGWSVVLGYPIALAGQAAYGPPAGALDAELFRTENRATVAGWLTVSGVLGASAGLLAFGLLWEVIGFAAAALVLFAPVALVAWLYLLLPETRHAELDAEETAVPRRRRRR